jgi:cytochrome bd ubiquinol oxidase subunit II
MMRRIPVSNDQYADGAFGWLRLFPTVTGIGLVLGYALLRAGWLALKSKGSWRDWARRRISWLTVLALNAMFWPFIIPYKITVGNAVLPSGGDLAFDYLSPLTGLRDFPRQD